jgi:predicted nucleic acid-binding protein
VSDFIVDASVAVKWFVAETDSLVADELSASGHRIFAPGLIMTEVANAVDEFIEPALENACALRHPIYDLIYLEAARRLDAQLVTADRRFTAKIAGTDFARHVTLLSDWRSE